MNKHLRRVIGGTMLAGIAGYLVGILTAPKSGHETRAEMARMGSQGMAEAEKQLKKLHTDLTQLLEAAQSMAREHGGKARGELEQLVAASQAAKQKARELLSAIHEGDADDQDLEAAIKAAKAAAKHLRAYLKR